MKQILLIILISFGILIGIIFIAISVKPQSMNIKQTEKPVKTHEPLPLQTDDEIINTSNSPSVETMKIKLFYVLLEGRKEGQAQIIKSFGCNDKLAAVDVEIPKTQTPLRAAIEELIAHKQRDIGNLYDALENSDLQLTSATIENKKAKVNLTGQFRIGGECDDPRIEEQLTQTVLQFPTISSAEITLDNKPIHGVLSLK